MTERNHGEYVIRYMGKDDMEMILLDILNFDGMIFKECAYGMITWCEIIEKFQHAITLYHNETLVGIIVSVDNKSTFGEGYDDQVGNSLSYIATLGIHEEHRKKGLGTLLLKCLEEKLTSTQEHFNIILDVDKENKDAIKLYSRNGYGIVKDLDEYQYIMIKSL